jgi:hypothetical protein
LILSDAAQSDFYGIFQYVDGTAYASDGNGMIIPTVQIPYHDVERLRQQIGEQQQTQKNVTWIWQLTDGDENEVLDTYNATGWQVERVLQRVLAGLLWALASYRLYQW